MIALTQLEVEAAKAAKVAAERAAFLEALQAKRRQDDPSRDDPPSDVCDTMEQLLRLLREHASRLERQQVRICTPPARTLLVECTSRSEDPRIAGRSSIVVDTTRSVCACPSRTYIRTMS